MQKKLKTTLSTDLLANIGADTAENEQQFAEFLTALSRPSSPVES